MFHPQKKRTARTLVRPHSDKTRQSEYCFTRTTEVNIHLFWNLASVFLGFLLSNDFYFCWIGLSITYMIDYYLIGDSVDNLVFSGTGVKPDSRIFPLFASRDVYNLLFSVKYGPPKVM